MSVTRNLPRIFAAILFLSFIALFAFPEFRSVSRAQNTALAGGVSVAAMTPEERGLHNLTHNPYGMMLLTAKLLESLPKVWEPEWQAKLDPNDPDSVRKLAFERYGFSEATWDNKGAPMQFVVNQYGGWVQNCMLCHGGRVPGTGQSLIGMPNTELDMQTLYEDLTKLTRYKPPFELSFGMSRGRTNAFVFSVELLRRRNEDLSTRKEPLPMGDFRDSDLDAIPWWHLKKKTALYVDAGVKGDFTRPIMQFTMGEPNGEKIRSWEGEFKDVLAYLRTIQPPKYPWPVDDKLAADGRKVFEKTCAQCHGTYGPDGKYPNKLIPLEVIGTDSVRLKGLTKEFRAYFNKTWFAGNSSHAEEDPNGYIAPPLDGVWASAPYFHNGSVPTIYGVLTQEARPKYFRRLGGAKEYDQQNLGLKVESLPGSAAPDLFPEAKRRIVDTTLPGLGNQGHPFGLKLSEKEKRQVMEYLKTL
jgi:mono/diheme cytochrome c family protein